MTVEPGHEQQVADFVATLSPAAKRTYCLGGTVKYELPCTDVQLSAVFDSVADAKERGLPVLDWGIHNASLEDVFIKLATNDEQQESGDSSAVEQTGQA